MWQKLVGFDYFVNLISVHEVFHKETHSKFKGTKTAFPAFETLKSEISSCFFWNSKWPYIFHLKNILKSVIWKKLVGFDYFVYLLTVYEVFHKETILSSKWPKQLFHRLKRSKITFLAVSFEFSNELSFFI